MKKKLAKDLVPGDVIPPPRHERGWMWKDGVKRMLTVVEVAEGGSDKRGPWTEVKATYGSPYSDTVSSGTFSMRPSTVVTCEDKVMVGNPAEPSEPEPVKAPSMIVKRGNWTDEPCFYVSVIDAGRTALVLGPFQDEAECRKWAYTSPEDGGSEKGVELRRVANDRDYRSWFYAWGMVKAPNGHREGVLNKVMGV